MFNPNHLVERYCLLTAYPPYLNIVFELVLLSSIYCIFASPVDQNCTRVVARPSIEQCGSTIVLGLIISHHPINSLTFLTSPVDVTVSVKLIQHQYSRHQSPSPADQILLSPIISISHVSSPYYQS